MKLINIYPKIPRQSLSDFFKYTILSFFLLITVFLYTFSLYNIAKEDKTNNTNLNNNPKYAIIDISKVIYSFKDIYSELTKTKKDIQDTYKELANLDKSLELQFIKEMEIYSNNILANHRSLKKKQYLMFMSYLNLK